MKLVEQTTHNLNSEYDEWVKQRFTSYTIIDKETSVMFSKKYKSKIQACYLNCWKIAIDEPKYSLHIGHVQCFGMPFTHAFLIKDNKVIDPTLAIKNRYGTEYYGMPIDKHKFVSLRDKAHWDDLIPHYLYRQQLEVKI